MTSPARAIDDRPARVVFALLVVASFVAFFVTQRLKHEPTAVQMFELTPVFSPTPAGHLKDELISFKLAHSDEVTVTIVNSAGAEIATLLRDRSVPRYKQLSLRWNGRRGSARGFAVVTRPDGSTSIEPHDGGAIAPPGEYRIGVSLRAQHVSVLSPRSFRLVEG